ncbi:MAG: non-canonical purine NTP pyrophosphatase [Deltaproteobacteria bacterium]|nr:non-canonical purine NTP pyrophosphatase [Deltaproteobacteria bacterium]
MSFSTQQLQLLFASTNKGKLAEVRQVASGAGITILSTEEVSALGKRAVPDVQENADTYSGNAKLKAEAFYAWSGLPSLADDAGIEVEALGGAPGVWSARYAGEPSDGKRNIEKMLAEMEGQSNRAARFTSFLFARVTPTKTLTAQCYLPGRISVAPHGSAGFGYDSIFIPQGYEKTLAEIKEDAALRSSFKTHRIMALEKIFPELSRALTDDALRTGR